MIKNVIIFLIIKFVQNYSKKKKKFFSSKISVSFNYTFFSTNFFGFFIFIFFLSLILKY